MMKKLVTFMLAVVMVATLLPTQAYANVGYERRLEQNKKWLEVERTDEYALDFYSLDFDYRNRTIEVTGYVGEMDKMDAIVKEITAGITDEYEKAKAIAEWLSSNMVYVGSAARREEYAHLPSWQYGNCSRFASTASTFYRLAGFPAKTVIGEANGLIFGWGGHAWNHVFVNGRWVYVDTVWGEFDLPVEKWSHDHALGHVEDFTNLEIGPAH